MLSDVQVEICVGGVRSAAAAEAGGADRVELCDNLMEGGTTPSAGMISVTRASIGIRLHVIIRPRGGDFIFSREEFEAMKYDIGVARDLGADGVVIGALNRDGDIDLENIPRLIEAAGGLSVTFHRAFDQVRDPQKALEQLIELGIDRVLTSGHASNAIEGALELRKYREQAMNSIRIMPGVGITAENVAEIVCRTGVQDVHVGGAVRTAEAGAGLHGEQLAFTDPEKVRTLVDAVRHGDRSSHTD